MSDITPDSDQLDTTQRNWDSYSGITRLPPSVLLAIDLAEMIGLVWLFLAYGFKWYGIFKLPSLIGGVLPLIVPWAGALGGVTISLVGVTAHWASWGAVIHKRDPIMPAPLDQHQRFNAWHLTRLPIGAIFGSAAALIVVLVTKTVGLTPENKIDVSPTGAATLALIAFVVGYREQAFRPLVDRVIDIILAPGSSTDAGARFELTPPVLEISAGVNQVGSGTVTLQNVGESAMRPSTPKVEGDNLTLRTTRLGSIAAGASADIVVCFSPTGPGDKAGTLSITVDGTTKTVALKGTVKQ